METSPRHRTGRERPSGFISSVRSMIQHYKLLAVMALMGAGGCAHAPNTAVNTTTSRPSAQEPAERSEEPKCKVIRIVPCKWIQYECDDGKKPVDYIGCG